MRILIHDASVLIDLIEVDLLEASLALPYTMETTDLVRREIIHTHQEEILDRVVSSCGLGLIRSSIDELLAISALQNKIPALSLADCSVLVHALNREASILSGDGLLRKTAATRSIPIYGTLWVFVELVRLERLTPQAAADSLQRLMKVNPRLPQAECHKLLATWNTQ